MADKRSIRQTKILDWLQKKGNLTIDELVERLGVSVMTIHRDLNDLEEAGQVRKVHGGVSLQTTPEETGAAARKHCALCGMAVSERTAFQITLTDNQQLCACCPHCGFLLLAQHPAAQIILVADFLHDRVINMQQAYFLVNCELKRCCSPTVLCFADEEEARRFQHGFGGDLMTYPDIQHHLSHTHTVSPSDHSHG